MCKQENNIRLFKKGNIYILHDIFTGDTISYENCVLGDNKYIWSNELIYYVEKYNAELPDEFIKHILKARC